VIHGCSSLPPSAHLLGLEHPQRLLPVLVVLPDGQVDGLEACAMKSGEREKAMSPSEGAMRRERKVQEKRRRGRAGTLPSRAVADSPSEALQCTLSLISWKLGSLNLKNEVRIQLSREGRRQGRAGGVIEGLSGAPCISAVHAVRSVRRWAECI
jgi:hypothetical protein